MNVISYICVCLTNLVDVEILLLAIQMAIHHDPEECILVQYRTMDVLQLLLAWLPHIEVVCLKLKNE
jgi:hypothetical protein